MGQKSAGGLKLKKLLSPTWRFMKMYLLKLGVLDGVYGFQIARITAKEVYWKYARALQLRQESVGRKE